MGTVKGTDGLGSICSEGREDEFGKLNEELLKGSGALLGGERSISSGGADVMIMSSFKFLPSSVVYSESRRNRAASLIFNLNLLSAAI